MKINLLSGDNQARSVVASAQRRLNVYAEAVDSKSGEPVQMVHYPTPGLRKLGEMPNGKPCRCLYRASNGDLYAVSEFDVYYIDPKFVFKKVGSFLSTTNKTPVKMADNGVDAILCDGTPIMGYYFNMKSRTGLKKLYDTSLSDDFTDNSDGWLGSTYVDFTDAYFIANFIDTPTFYISNLQSVVFDAQQRAGKSSYPDKLVAAIVQKRVIWLIGEVSTEIWYNTGSTTSSFPFELIPGVSIDYGCKAPYSIVKANSAIYFLGQTQYGLPIVLTGVGYAVKRVSTHALEHALSSYDRIDDCVAFCHIIEGHPFYVMSFLSANVTWALDLTTGLWAQRAWTDKDGEEHRHRAHMHAFAYDLNVVSDWENANLYELDTNSYTDNGDPIKRVVSFPRQIDDETDHRVLFRSFMVEFDVGQSHLPNDDPYIMLTWSDDKGVTWNAGLKQPIGKMGAHNTTINFNRLGLSRNRVFRLEYQANALTALVGAFVDIVKAAS